MRSSLKQRLRDLFVTRRRNTTRRAGGSTVRLSLEALEDRRVPSAHFGSALALGSNGSILNIAKSVQTDAAGDVYVEGTIRGTTPVNFAPAGASPVTLNPAGYVNNTTSYLAKYSPGEQQLLWVIPTVSNNDMNRVYTMAVDSSGDAYCPVLDTSTGVYTLNKYDPNGNLLWSNNLSQSLGFTPTVTGITVDSSGNAYLTGYPNNYYNANNFVAKFSGANGNLVWNETYNKGNVYGAQDSYVAVDPSGNVYLTGAYGGKSNFNPHGTYYLTSYGSKSAGYAQDSYVMKLDPNGNFLWAGSMGTDTSTAACGIAVDAAGNVYLSGTFKLGKTYNNFNPKAGVVDSLGGGTSYLVKLDTNGNYVWGDGWANVYFQFSNDLALDSAGNIYLTGEYTGTANFNPGSGQNILTTPGTYQAFVLKLDNGGNFAWVAGTSSSQSGGAYARGWNLAVDGSGDVFTAGDFNATTNFDPGTGTYNLTPAGGDSGFLWELTQS